MQLKGLQNLGKYPLFLFRSVPGKVEICVCCPVCKRTAFTLTWSFKSQEEIARNPGLLCVLFTYVKLVRRSLDLGVY